MKRGILNLNKQQADALYTILLGNQENISQSLLNKFLVEPNDDENFIVELSEEDVDIILDIMPIPSKDDVEILISTRSKISQFLLKLRS